MMLAAPAFAGDDFIITTWMDLGSGQLGAGEFFESDYLVTGEPNELVVGFELQYDYSEPVPDNSWASDAQVVVSAPTGEVWTVGGFTNLPLADQEWSFQGGASDGPGHYGSDGADIFLPWVADPIDLGLFNVTFTNDWLGDGNPNLYANTQIRFYKVVPGPGALALLSLAGLVRRRRRRR